MMAPKNVIAENHGGKMDFMKAEKQEIERKYFFSTEFSIEERNAAIQSFNDRWLASDGLPATCIAKV